MANRTCSFPDCDREHDSHGYCAGHLAQRRRGLELRPIRAYGGGKCSIPECPNPLRSLGWCNSHYKLWRKYGDPLWKPTPRTPNTCRFPGCEHERWTLDYCRSHRRQLRKGEALRALDPPRKYVIDDHFFDEIDSEAKAYWLGFITADGCISRKAGLSINLASGDAGHLEKLSTSLSSDYPVRLGRSGRSRSGTIARWHADSMPIVLALGALGVTPRKSLVVQPWDGPVDLMPHYWRGMVDGDGGMSLAKGRPRPTGQWRIYLYGSQACVEGFARWAVAICGSTARPGPDKPSGPVWSWKVGGNRVTRLVVEELYGNCSISLARKQALADIILGRHRDDIAA